MNEQINYLNKINNINHTPTFVFLEIFDDKTKKYHPGNKYPIGKYQLIDHRVVASNEVIFELDFSSWNKNHEVANRIIEILKNRGYPYYAFASGGKGIHISVFFDKIKFDEGEQKELFKKALQYRLTYKKIRLWFWKLILEEAGLYDKDICKPGGKIDSAPINFNDETGKNHPIRACGGRKKIRDNILKTEQTTYKFYLAEDIPKKKPIVTNINNVKFPDKLELVSISESEFATFLDDYIKSEEDRNIDPMQNINIDSPYTELQSVKKAMEGLKVGQRAMGARIISISCHLDGLSLARCEQALKQYVDNCSQTGESFNYEEANRWSEWVYSQPEVFWNCSLANEIGIHDEQECAVCQINNKEVNKLLTDKNIIKRFDDFLSKTIVGEEKNRILTLLLLLSSRFLVDKKWNILGDPKPASVIFSSMSASGKTWLTKQLLPLFGKEGDDYYTFSRMTKTALNYFADVDMNKKILFTEELQGLDAESNQLRLWISEGSLKLASVESIKQQDGTSSNELTFKKTKGQPVFITGTAEDAVDEQMNNRSWLISLDISESQNKRILQFEDKVARGEVTYDEHELRVLQDSIKQLKSYHFIIPYYDFELLNIPTNDVRIRRDYSKFRYIICCSALLHQKQRLTARDEETGNEYLICNFEDYEIAKTYSEDVLQATFSGLTKTQIDLLQQIKEQVWATEFETDEVQRLTGWSQSKVYMTLKQLEEIGVVTSKGHKPGTASIYSYNNKKKLVDLSLPKKDELTKMFKEKRPRLFSYLEENGFLFLKGNENAKTGVSQTSLIIGDLRKFNELNDVSEPISKNTRLVFEQANKQTKGNSIRIAPLKSPKKTSKSYGISSESQMSSLKKLALYTKNDVLNFMKNHKKQIVSYDDVSNNFEKVENMINELKTSGDIFEIRPAHYVVL